MTTTDPAATIAHRPIVTGATHTARAPMEEPSRQVTPTGDTKIVRIDVAVQGAGGQELGRATMVRPATPDVGL